MAEDSTFFLPISSWEGTACTVSKRRLLEVNSRSLTAARLLDANVLRVIHHQGELSRNGFAQLRQANHLHCPQDGSIHVGAGIDHRHLSLSQASKDLDEFSF